MTARLTPWWFSPTIDNDSGVEFHLRPLTTPQKMDLLDTYKDIGNGRSAPTHKSYMFACQCGVIGVRGFEDPRTKRAAVVPSVFDIMDPAWVIECATELMVAAMPDDPGTEDLEKN
jgi:hypothetical protein